MSTASQWLLRIAVAIAFIYPALHALSNPGSWIGYFPPFLLNSGIAPEVLLHGFGIIEIVIALWILSGWHIEWPATLAALMLGGIVAFNGAQFEILFRDVSIALACLALADDAWSKVKRKRSVAEASSV
ncbi:MAG: DoxX family membrane protein [Candidatus Pacebacteria bacterium]|nr:DoxX family membrane protein [Candidatus Paceibacterota bacterium]